MRFHVENFRKVEEQVQDRSIEIMPVSELVNLKTSLITNTPPAEVDRIMQTRWDRAYKEILSQIDSKVANACSYANQRHTILLRFV